MARAIARSTCVRNRPSRAARWTADSGAAAFSKNASAADPGACKLDRRSGPAGSYLGEQKRIVLENCGEIDPLEIDDYLSRDGYRALERCLKEIHARAGDRGDQRIGLRGAGARAFPRGKWSLGARAGGRRKYVICTGRRRSGPSWTGLVLESDRTGVLEGLASRVRRGAAEVTSTSGADIPKRCAGQAASSRRKSAACWAEHVRHGPPRCASSCGRVRRVCVRRRDGADSILEGKPHAQASSAYPLTRLRGSPPSSKRWENPACVPWILRRDPPRFRPSERHSKGTQVFAPRRQDQSRRS